MALVIDSVSALRTLRAEFTPPGQENEAARAAMLARRFTVTIVPENETAKSTLIDQQGALTTLARVGEISFADAAPEGRWVPSGVPGATLYVPAGELLEGIDPAKEAVRLTGEVAKIDKEASTIAAKLANPGFVSKAEPEVVEKARQDAADLAGRRERLLARKALLEA
jgi:valyl-tRNA synthetase